MSLLSRLAVQAARAYGMLVAGSANNVSAEYLVVAGGGSSAKEGGGGGGGGGLLTSTTTLSTLNTYSIAVGAGGTYTSGQRGTNGVNSSISGTGLSTITAIGGGAGGSSDQLAGAGASGGSGGGGSGTNGASSGNSTTGGAGTSGQGYAGGSQPNANKSAAGGGGAGAVGQDGSTNGGNGGVGIASSISGSSVYYAGGGGGGMYYGGVGGSGGNGGGGAGGNTTVAGTAGTANTGGGAGGGGNAQAAGANGGSGIVIISYTSATPKFVGGTITTSGGKQIHTFTSSGTLSPLTPITASYLVVAGGGGGGSRTGGGGGAGGLLTSSTTLYSGATYVVTVGGGGSGGIGSTGTNGASGSNSSVSGTGLTTLTAIGGGFGSGENIASAGNGGSGGGAAVGTSTVGTGTAGQGNNGGTSNPSFGAGGGGGAGAVGGNANASTAGVGGAGSSSSISGTSVTYAGGGGGGGGAAVGTGGAGGGGNGGTGTSVGSSGNNNLGGGGGGGSAAAGTGYNGGSGGSGIVIISYAGSQQFNGGLVTTSGGNTIHTFTSTGALTPLTNNLTNSLRFRSSASAFLNRTPSVTGNQRTWTFSAWVKRGALSGGTQFGRIMSTQGSFGVGINFMSDDTLRMYFGGSAVLQTTQVFRDPSAWYHIVLAFDTTQATAANRVRLFVNGSQVTAFSSTTYPNQNDTFGWNNGSIVHQIGASTGDGAAAYFDGYMDDIYSVDGQALEPYFFGNNDANGVWKPIQYRGTYGTNGFYLNFSNTTSTTTLGFDSSPNGNNWTCNNISLTAGVTYDAMTDVPTNTSATVANYAVMNPLVRLYGTATLSDANLKINDTSTGGGAGYASIAVTSGKFYYEFSPSAVGKTSGMGVTFASTYSFGYDGCYVNNGSVSNTTGGSAATYASYTTNDVIGVAFDADAGKVWFYKNGTIQAGDPVAGTGSAFTWAANSLVTATYAMDNSAGTVGINVNFGQRPFTYTPPTGYVRLNTFNLPTPTILQGNRFMDATLYTQNGAASNVVVNAGQFRPDLVWIKCRSNAGTWNVLVDSVRGVSSTLATNSTAAQDTFPVFSSFNSNGFTLPLGDSGTNNTAGRTQVAWQWQAGQSSGSSNTAGSITSTVSASTTAGFSVVTYTGTGSNATVGHGLGVAPRFIAIKCRNDGTIGWVNYHASLGNTQFLNFNNTNAAATGSTVWNNTSPTSTTFAIGTDGAVNGNTKTYVAYCWAEIAGFSAFGSYTGANNTGASTPNANGPFVYLGFRPKFVLIKRTSSAAQWVIYDSSRGTFNANYPWLYPNATDAETATEAIDFLSNGFKIRSESGATMFPDGATFIYAAFAEHPFKNSNAR